LKKASAEKRTRRARSSARCSATTIPKASIAGEIIPCKEFYDYDAKYLVEGSEAVIPAKITKAEMKTVQRLAIAAFQAVDCTGLARVDFLMDPKSRKIFVNEINTMPGFTAISMYPKMWVASGVPYPELIDRLIQLGHRAPRRQEAESVQQVGAGSISASRHPSCARRYASISVRPSCLAHSAGVACHRVSFQSNLAPRSTRSRTTSGWPATAAWCNGVDWECPPSGLYRFGSSPASSNIRTISR
jgi:hypothetical protein